MKPETISDQEIVEAADECGPILGWQGRDEEHVIAFARAILRLAAERADTTVAQYLSFNSQRAVSWHEVNDCRAEIRRALTGGER